MITATIIATIWKCIERWSKIFIGNMHLAKVTEVFKYLIYDV